MNCLTYTISKAIEERRAGRRGGYILMRRSYLARLYGITNRLHPVQLVPHFMHRDQDGNVTQYVPTAAQKREFIQQGLFQTWLRLWHFDGIVVGDDDPTEYKGTA